MSSSTTHHLAAILHSAGSPLSLEQRPTPTPSPSEVLIAVKSVALNPVDVAQQASGFHISRFPTVLGSDVAGTVLLAGASSSSSSSALAPGTRVAAFASAFYTQGDPDRGALQARVCVPAAAVAPLPAHVGFDVGALLPMAVQTAWAGIHATLGVPREGPAERNQALLVWGAASSVGTAAVQVARVMGFAVYATASPKHHGYLKGLGATRVFDYRDGGVMGDVVDAVKGDGVVLKMAYDAYGGLQQCQEVLSKLNPGGGAKLASAPPLPQPTPQTEGVETKFVLPPDGEEERMDFYRYVFGTWLKEKLETKEFVPSPSVKVVGGLEDAQAGLDELKGGVSGTKLVLRV